MQLSLFSDYSLRVLMYAAVKNDLFQIGEVTAAYRISAHHLAKVVQALAKFGYLETRRGRGGGLKLACPAEKIGLGQLVRQTENDGTFVECFDAGTNTCVLDGHCRLKGVLRQALNNFYSVLDRYTLADLVTGPHRREMLNVLAGVRSDGESRRPLTGTHGRKRPRS